MSVGVCHGRIWQEDFDSAYSSVKKSNNLLLVGFVTPGNQRAEQLAYALEQLLKIPYMNQHCDVVYSNMLTNEEMAHGMKVFRVGTLLTLLPNGKQIGRLNEPLPVEQLKAYMDGLLPALNKYVDQATETTLPLTLRDGFIHGDLALGPVSLSARNNKPVEVGILERDKEYLIVVSGEYSVWPDVRNRGVDAVFYGHPKNLAIKPHVRTKTLKLESHKKNFSDILKEQGGGGPVFRETEHVYEVMITGTGEPLTMVIADQSPHDNSGELFVTVYARKQIVAANARAAESEGER